MTINQVVDLKFYSWCCWYVSFRIRHTGQTSVTIGHCSKSGRHVSTHADRLWLFGWCLTLHATSHWWKVIKYLLRFFTEELAIWQTWRITIKSTRLVVKYLKPYLMYILILFSHCRCFLYVTYLESDYMLSMPKNGEVPFAASNSESNDLETNHILP